MILVLTMGHYSNLQVILVLEGLAPELEFRASEFQARYGLVRGNVYYSYEERMAVNARLRSEGVTIVNTPRGTRSEDPAYTYSDDDVEWLFVSWLLTRPGWRVVEYHEVDVTSMLEREV